MAAHKIVVHKIDLPPMRLEWDPVFQQVSPQAVQVAGDLLPLHLGFADVGEIHEVELDDVIQPGPVPSGHIVAIRFCQLDLDG